jgi:hypothetical protein
VWEEIRKFSDVEFKEFISLTLYLKERGFLQKRYSIKIKKESKKKYNMNLFFPKVARI